jgi:ABC-2 type transport system ATP-binding protein
VSFTARAGEVTGYLGPNGSGKSTTMKMITGLLETTSGKVFFNGVPIAKDLIAYKQRMGYVPEEPHLYSHLSGLEYLLMVGQLRNLPARPAADCIDGLLRLFSLHADRHAPISAYSKGMRQKVLLSAPLLHNPDLLLDEAFSGLDVATGLVLRSLIQELAARQGGVFSSHELETVGASVLRVIYRAEVKLTFHRNLRTLVCAHPGGHLFAARGGAGHHGCLAADRRSHPCLKGGIESRHEPSAVSGTLPRVPLSHGGPGGFVRAGRYQATAWPVRQHPDLLQRD